MNKFNHQSGRYLEREGARIYYEEIGNPDKKTLLFLHGGLQHIGYFNPIIPFFAEDYSIIGIDSRGHGGSTLGEKNLSYKLLQQDIEAILESLNITSLSIIGFSDGGILAYWIASKGLFKIEKLVTIGATWSIDDIKASEELFRRITPESWKQKFPESFESYQKLNPQPQFEEYIKATVAMWVDETVTGHPNKEVEKIACPTLIIRGDEDHLFSRESAVKLATKINEASFLNIPFVGHQAFDDQLGIFVSATKHFLTKVPEDAAKLTID